MFTGSAYQALDLKRNNIIALKFKTGYLQPYVGDYDGLPINRTFYAGGSNSIRGWRSNQLVPEDAPKATGLLNNGVNVKGGTFLLEGTMEYRYRFFQSFGLVGFLITVIHG
ncbi:MAG: outer membrane protein assembly factor [Ignavibacteriales bacterium]|nr:outer membrane protein assembly factor [Ignavibacteriales bacterium]